MPFPRANPLASAFQLGGCSRADRGDIVRALLAGTEAGRNAAPVTTCPYPSGDLRRSARVRGYTKSRPHPTDVPHPRTAGGH
ncbi:Rmf/CrpP fold protein [Streptomyces albidoflavus]|uniref:Rmf/CrpP fold protein n=1 Tax=Streptomyces TaxID=1883 RepID=UPI00315A7FDF